MSRHARAEVESPTDLKKPSWRFAMRSAIREFQRDDCTNLAAALTYYAVLSLFPAAIALISLVGLVGEGPRTVSTLLDIVRDLGAGSMAESVEGPLTDLSRTQSAGVTLVLGLMVALWSASGYVTAFGQAMNRVYEVDEGRPVWKLRPWMLLITLIAVVLVAVVVLGLVLTGPAAQAVGNAIGLGDTTILIWGIAKWPVMFVLVAGIIALLYDATPNVRQPGIRWISIGAVFAIVVWAIASAGFGFYVANFSSYDKTYGTLAGVVAFLLWLWITNLALLLGAELNSELERSRELQAGLPAEEQLQLEPRDTRAADKAAKKDAAMVEQGRRLRKQLADAEGADDSKEHVHAS